MINPSVTEIFYRGTTFIHDIVGDAYNARLQLD